MQYLRLSQKNNGWNMQDNIKCGPCSRASTMKTLGLYSGMRLLAQSLLGRVHQVGGY